MQVDFFTLFLVVYSLLHLQIVPEHWMLLMICSSCWYILNSGVFRSFDCGKCLFF
jgi:hypothetical protein